MNRYRRYTDGLPLYVYLFGFIAFGMACIWVGYWVTPDPATSDCVEVIDLDLTELHYSGLTNVWSYKGAAIGWSATEDAKCIEPLNRGTP